MLSLTPFIIIPPPIKMSAGDSHDSLLVRDQIHAAAVYLQTETVMSTQYRKMVNFLCLFLSIYIRLFTVLSPLQFIMCDK